MAQELRFGPNVQSAQAQGPIWLKKYHTYAISNFEHFMHNNRGFHSTRRPNYPVLPVVLRLLFAPTLNIRP